MIQPFVDSIPLFGRAYALALITAALLGLAGVVVVARRQVFLGVAVAQASGLGLAVGVWASAVTGWAWLDAGATHSALSIGVAVLATLLTMTLLHAGNGSRLAGEEIAAWVFIVGGVGTMLLLANLPSGSERLTRLTRSSIVAASWFDVAAAGGLLLLAAALVAAQWRRLVLLLSDPVMASAVGVRTARWNLIIALALGLAIGVTARGAGLLMVFGCLVLPAVAAKQLVNRVAPLLIAAPLLGVVAALIGLVIGFAMNWPPGPTIVAVLAAATALAYATRAALDRV